MGIWERMTDTFRDKLGAEFHFAPPRDPGTDTVETIKQMHEGKIQFFLGMGGNFLAATPDTEYTAEGAAEMPANGACLHEAEPVASYHGRDCAYSAMPGSIRS